MVKMVTQALKCERHGETTRLTCVDCEKPICPKCMVRTEVGLKCEADAVPAGPAVVGGRPSKLPILIGIVGLVVLAAVAFLLLGSSEDPEEEVAALPPVGTWTEAPGLASIRGTATAVVLDDGTVLAAGGGVGAIALEAAEIFDPEAQAWRQVAPLAEARRGHQAVLLDDGRVLVAGGLASGVPLASAEIYDPAADSWSPVASMSVPRLGHSLTLLSDGRVLAAGGSALESEEAAGGGQTIRTVATSEIFDPSAGAWSEAAEMGTPRFEHTATLLGDGRVFMVGGLGPTEGAEQDLPLRSTEFYDPAANAFVSSSDLAEGRANHAAALLNDNALIVSGGTSGESGDVSVASAEVFDNRAATWTTVSSMGTPRTGHTATALEDGRVLVAGGETVRRGSRRSLTSAEVFEFDLGASGEWRSGGDMVCPRSEQAAVLLGDGSVLVIAGDAAFPGQAPMAQSCVGRYQP
jgi:N-acetylneuraminic acid mutarotase